MIENDINTIIDLRSDYERVETPLQDTGDVEIDRYTIDLTGGSFKIALFNKLTFVKKCSILVTKLVRNDDEEARRIICKDVLANMTLSELAAITLTKSTSGIAQIFKIISEKSGKGGILIHCTQGKDRTGIVILLIFLLCGIKLKFCDQDYMITNHYLNTDRWIINNELVKDEEPPRALKAMVTNGLPLQVFAKCENGWVDNVADELLRLTGLERANNSDIKVEDWREDHVKSAIDLYLQQYCDISIEVITSVRDHLQSV